MNIYGYCVHLLCNRCISKKGNSALFAAEFSGNSFMLLTDIYLGTMSLTVALSHLPLLYRSFAVLRTIHISIFSSHVSLSVFFVCLFVCFIAVVTSLFKTVTGQRGQWIHRKLYGLPYSFSSIFKCLRYLGSWTSFNHLGSKTRKDSHSQLHLLTIY